MAATGCPAYSNRELLPGILKVLRSGSRWCDLDSPDCPHATTHWRRLPEILQALTASGLNYNRIC
jgi:transposase